MIKLLIRAALCWFMLMVTLTAYAGQEPSALRYRFATQEEGRKLKLANTDYLEALTQNDIDWKLQSSGQ